jgi:hypothetical protein|tara:strand:+ start:3188 stop:4024 length:837 start_codon:yes stop_codon:yes gene_type:complete
VNANTASNALMQSIITQPVLPPNASYIPMRINLQGQDGIGKSTFAANADKPIFIQAEDGLDYIKDVARFPKCETWTQIFDNLMALYETEHDYKTVVLDTTDAAHALCEIHVCEQNNWRDSANNLSIEKPGFGKGFTAVKERFQGLLNNLNTLREEKNMNVILLSHVHIKPHNDPNLSEPYDRWEMRCSKGVNSLIKDWVDFNLFAAFETSLMKDGSKAKAKSYGNRSMHTKFSAGFDAKSRIALPEKMPLSWPTFIDEYTKALNPAQSPETKVAKGGK